MKSTDKKAEFIELRAKGESYSKIASQLHISKSTCSSWERDLAERIAEQKEARLSELYTMYGMDKEARIKRLGDTLEDIDRALTKKNLEDLPADILLKYKLQYEQELREEYSEPTNPALKEVSLEEIIKALMVLYLKQENGQIKPAQAKAQLSTLTLLLNAERLKNNASYFWEDGTATLHNDITQ